MNDSVHTNKRSVKSRLLWICLAGFLRMSRLKSKHQRKLEAESNLWFDPGVITLKGINRIAIRQCAVSDKTGRFRVRITNIKISVSLGSILRRRLRIDSLIIEQADIEIGSAAANTNGAVQSAAIPDYMRYYRLLFTTFDRLLRFIPDKVQARAISINVGRINWRALIDFEKKKDMRFCLDLTSGNTISGELMTIKGRIEGEAKTIVLHELTGKDDVLRLALPGGRVIAVATRQLECRLVFGQRTAGKRPFHLSTKIGELAFDSNSQQSIRGLELDVQGCLEKDRFYLSDGSYIILNRIRFIPRLEHDMKKNQVMLKVETAAFTSEDVFDAFPFFVLKDLYSIKTTGSLIFQLSFTFSMHGPMQYVFNASLVENEFEIADHGRADLTFLNAPFSVMMGNTPEETIFWLDQDNPAFAKLGEFPDMLIKVILTTEDPNFLFHGGIDESFLGYAAACNISERRFSRGGSTITMQLVRNVFLNHRKTLSRKLEEMIISWLVEQYFCVSKSRILELYCNIIEMGPGIYGLKKASHFYFDKSPAELDLTECLILSYVIPRPKFFLEAVQMGSPQLYRNLKAHMQRYSKILFTRELITKEELAGIRYSVELGNGLGMLPLEEVVVQS